MPETNYREAIRAAHREAMQRDARVFVMGEDVGRYGGSYAVTKGLLAEFGEQRVRHRFHHQHQLDRGQTVLQ